MGSKINLCLSLEELSALIDLIESAEDLGISLNETQEQVYKYLQINEAEKVL